MIQARVNEDEEIRSKRAANLGALLENSVTSALGRFFQR